MSTGDWIEIGVVGRPHGVRGEIRIHVSPRFRGAAARLDRLALTSGEEGNFTAAKIESIRAHNDLYLVVLDIAPDRTAAAAFTGAAIFARAPDLERAGARGPFPEQLVGLAVRTESGERVGSVDRIDDYPAGDMLVVRDGEKEHLIPSVPQIVLSIDVEKGEVVIRPIPGLLDLSS